MNIKKRLEKLEAAAEVQTTKHILTEIILVSLTRETANATSSFSRWCCSFFSISEEELTEMPTDHQTLENNLL